MSPRGPRSAEAMQRAERISTILETLATTGSVHVGELAGRFKVSAATLRRDLALLEAQRLLTRTHGGALAHDVAYELPVRYRDGRQRDQKRAIALAAVQRLPAGPYAVGLTGGTTTSEVARALADRGELTVVTNALNIAMELALRSRVKVIVSGGVARVQSYELVGPFAEQTLGGINIGIAFIGVDGVSAAGGLTTHDETEAHTNRAMIRRAQRVVVVADGTKVGRVMLAHIAPLSEIYELITDDSADPAELEAIRRGGVAVHVTRHPAGGAGRTRRAGQADGSDPDGAGADGAGADDRPAGMDGSGEAGTDEAGTVTNGSRRTRSKG
jgi:DeoR family transcriptional regulator of aga operon